MLNVQNILVTTFAFAVRFLVPAVVWLTLMAGLSQLIHSSVHRLGDLLSGSRKVAQRSIH